jgi:hypothetical protein
MSAVSLFSFFPLVPGTQFPIRAIGGASGQMFQKFALFPPTTMFCVFLSGCTQITCIDAGPLSSGNGSNGSSSSCSERYGSDLNSGSRSPCPRPQLFLQLQYLDLTDCVGLGDAGVQMIVRSCTQLTCLYLRRCAHVTGEYFVLIDLIINYN